ncbi:alpha/beta hydrolase [Hyphobacterium sp. SN044]|uniref:alpha/beta hydrolase n=1 Tax=Hyphobacterium sp. SN044 TaxID=2912575 RepID=UPI001F3875A3|nr:alpha/beta hydrolase [Hyphobacterium sp. SN044]MCF8879750.1 alpha/beta hydrolase [Hyphobacterium sp. SN044]
MSDFGKEFWTKLGMSDPFASDAMIARVRDGMGKAPELIEATPPAILDTHDLDIPGPAGPLKARLYRPEHAHETGPLCVFFHGGGYVFGDLDSHDRVCRRLCAIANVRVLAIAYRLAPENPFPAAYDDCLAAFDWAVGQGAARIGADTTRVAVAGDSAGGGLAAAVAQARRGQLRFQLLIYPLLQLAEVRKDKLKAFEGHFVSAKSLNWIRDNYAGSTETARDPRVSPLFCTDLAGLPPAYIAVAEYDPLKDEGAAYADMLSAAGVRAELHFAKALPHGYFNFTRMLPVAKKLADKAADALGRALAD